jgi:hypothetical protein
MSTINIVPDTPTNVSGAGVHTINVQQTGNFTLNYTLYGGGGGGGLGTISANNIVGAGGGGACAIVSSLPSVNAYITSAQSFNITGPTTFTVTIGAGGSRATGNGGNGLFNGATGGPSVITVNSNSVTAFGGQGGRSAQNGGAGGTAGGGTDPIYNGGNGIVTPNTGIGGDGGPTSGSIAYGKGGFGGDGNGFGQDGFNGGAVLILNTTIPPTINSVTVGNGTLSVNFTPSAEPNQTNHVVEILNGSTVVGTQTFVTPTNPQVASFSGLINGVTYTVRVTVNAQSGSASTTDTGTPIGPVAPPTNVTATAGINSVNVSFTLSASPSSTISGYTVLLTSTTPNVPSVTPQTVSNSTTSASFTGLIAGASYTASVTANGSGNYQNSSTVTSSSVISTGSPDKPVITSLQVSSSQLIVNFTKSLTPVAYLSDYNVTLTDGSIAITQNVNKNGPYTSTFTNLTNYVEYTAIVTAIGSGSPVTGTSVSDEVTGTPQGPPAPATAVTITNPPTNPNELVVTFTPSITPSSALSPYSVVLTSTTQTITQTVLETGPYTSTFSGLAAGVSYTARVFTNVGSTYSIPSNPSISVVATGNPAPPTNINVSPGNEALTVTFTPSASPQSYITRYEITVSDLPPIIIPSNGPYSYSFLGLTNGELLDIEVTAVHDDDFKASNTSSGTPSIVPPFANGVAGDGTIQITLNDPYNSPGTVQYYVVVTTIDPETGLPVTIPNLSPYTDTSILLTGLSNGIEYEITIYARQIDGDEESELITLSLTPQAINVVCYAKGTLISTSRGWIPIENLLMSDKLKTHGCIEETIIRPVYGMPVKSLVRVDDTRYKNQFGSIKFIGKFTVNIMNENTAPIRFIAGSLGPSTPKKDLLVSPNHSMLIGERFMFAKSLVNGSSIYQDMSFKKIEYFHILSDNHYVINANGALSETLGTEETELFESLYSFPEYIEIPKNKKYINSTQKEVDLLSFTECVF